MQFTISCGICKEMLVQIYLICSNVKKCYCSIKYTKIKKNYKNHYYLINCNISRFQSVYVKKVIYLLTMSINVTIISEM